MDCSLDLAGHEAHSQAGGEVGSLLRGERMTQLYPGFLTAVECQALESWAEELRYRPVPSWLGNFTFHVFGRSNGKDCGPAPEAILVILRRIGTLVPGQTWTTIFAQKYETGNYVKSHRDPRNNVGKTLISVVGTFTGAETTVDGVQLTMTRGDVLELDCTINGVQGPRHAVSPVLSGVRYAAILNTLE